MLRTPLVVLTLAASGLRAQLPDSAASPTKIQDNSFLVEEAYNQEAGIVQHIGTMFARRGSSELELGFAQEWPIRSITHQISYDIPFSTGGSAGVGDIGVNYRYQLRGHANAMVAVAPRITLFIPTGDWKRSRGNGALGGELGVAVSYVVSSFVSSHTNAGAGLIPNARNSAGDKANIYDWSVGQSLILTASSFIQPMLETVYSRGTEVAGKHITSARESFVISPGARMAINFRSGLQVVPGLAVPIGIGPSSGERGVFFYLSFEHAFRR